MGANTSYLFDDSVCYESVLPISTETGQYIDTAPDIFVSFLRTQKFVRLDSVGPLDYRAIDDGDIEDKPLGSGFRQGFDYISAEVEKFKYAGDTVLYGRTCQIYIDSATRRSDYQDADILQRKVFASASMLGYPFSVNDTFGEMHQTFVLGYELIVKYSNVDPMVVFYA